MTRTDYLENRVSHQQYYEAVASEAGISYGNCPMLPKIKEALARGDQHLNTIDLAYWDMLSERNRKAINAALHLHEDFYSKAGGVCVMKAAAKKAALEAMEAEEQRRREDYVDESDRDYL